MINGMNIAVQLYSVRDDAEKDFAGTLRKIKAMGYDGVEFAGLYGLTPEAVRNLVAETGLIPISAHVSINELAADPAGCVSAYKTIGCQYIVVPWLDEGRRPGQSDWEKVKSDIVIIAAECEKQGLTPLYHNHDFEFIKKDGEYLLDRLYKEIPALHTEIDTCWVKVAGVDPAAYVRQYKGRAPVVHLKDFMLAGEKPKEMYELIGVDNEESKEEKDTFEFRPLGCGLQDIPSLIQAAADAGAGWVVVEQDSPSMGKTPLESVQTSIEYLFSIR